MVGVKITKFIKDSGDWVPMREWYVNVDASIFTVGKVLQEEFDLKFPLKWVYETRRALYLIEMSMGNYEDVDIIIDDACFGSLINAIIGQNDEKITRITLGDCFATNNWSI